MGELKDNPKAYPSLINQCLEMFRSDEEFTVLDIAVALMDNELVPMHYPYHHFIVPAALLTACHKANQSSEAQLQESLNTALDRAKIVIGGYCGSHGACGAGIGMGVFMSVYTGNTPMSVESWSWANEATGLCLQEIAAVPGPRCCKRVTFITLKTAVPLVRERLGIPLAEIGEIECKYYERNKECKKKSCPFYPAEL